MSTRKTLDKAIKAMDEEIFYVTLMPTMRGVERTTIMIKAKSKAEAKQKAEKEASQYHRVGKVESREDSRRSAGNHGVISNNWKK